MLLDRQKRWHLRYIICDNVLRPASIPHHQTCTIECPIQRMQYCPIASCNGCVLCKYLYSSFYRACQYEYEYGSVVMCYVVCWCHGIAASELARCDGNIIECECRLCVCGDFPFPAVCHVSLSIPIVIRCTLPRVAFLDSRSILDRQHLHAFTSKRRVGPSRYPRQPPLS